MMAAQAGQLEIHEAGTVLGQVAVSGPTLFHTVTLAVVAVVDMERRVEMQVNSVLRVARLMVRLSYCL